MVSDLSGVSTREKLEMLVSKNRKSGRRTAYGWFLFSLFVTGWIISSKMEPILELSEMKVAEGVLVDFVDRKGLRSYGPKIVLREDSGSAYAILANAAAGDPYYTLVKQLKGKRIKVWLQDTCRFGMFLCSPSMNQLQYQDKVIVDYNGFVRINMEEFRGWGIKGTIIFFVPLLTFLLGLLVLFLREKQAKRMRKEFEIKGIGV